ncbi:MAG: S41 family peptidase [Planctomycetes bacterium]|nr:S41 family peptidase [Planctomycetota bacterium]
MNPSHTGANYSLLSGTRHREGNVYFPKVLAMPRRETVWVTVIVALIVLSMGPVRKRKEENLFPQFLLLAEMMEKIRSHYVEEVKDEELFQGALDGVVSTLDPYSQYLPPKEAEELQVDTEGEYEGLGIVIAIRNQQLTVITPIEDTPAFKAGVLAGDRILTINDESTEGITQENAIAKLRGRAGTKVTLSLHHESQEGSKDVRKITLTRARIEVQSVKGLCRAADGRGWNFWVDEAEGIGYIRVNQFQEKTMPALDEAMKRLTSNSSRDLKGLILDLRFNPGGLLNVAIEMADRFIRDDLIVFTKGRARDSFKKYLARSDDDYPAIPLVVLINKGSASASEIVAGCIQDRKRGTIVGSRSFGKGSVQSIINLDEAGDNHKLKLTTAYYYTPLGRNIHRTEGAKESDVWGVIPDVVVDLTPEELKELVQQRNESEVLRTPSAETRPAGGAESGPPGEAEPGAGPPSLPSGWTPDKQLRRAIEIFKSLNASPEA